MAQQAVPERVHDPAQAVFRHSASFSYLQPLNPGTLSSGVSGFRLSLSRALDPRLALEASVLRVAGAGMIIDGLGAGARFTRFVGPVRLSPVAEAVVGQPIVDEGGWYVGEGAKSTYRPYRRPGNGVGLGVGVIANAKWFHRSGIGADVQLGYWQFASPKVTGALMAGVGLRLGRRSPEWYWRTSGGDDVPPRFVVESPAPGVDGIRALGTDTLRIVAADRSGIRLVAVDGVPVALRAGPRVDAELPGMRARSAVARVQHRIPVGTHPLRIEVWDGAGNRSEDVVWVSGAEPAPVEIVLATPTDAATVQASYVDVSGFAMGVEPGVRAVVNGCPVEAYPSAVVGKPAHAFSMRLPLEPGRNTIVVQAERASGGSGMLRREILHSPRAAMSTSGGPPVLTPSIRHSASGRAVRIFGFARDANDIGIREVRVGGVPAGVRRPTGAPDMAEYLAYAGLEGDTAVEVLATTFDGRISSTTVAVPGAAVARPAGAALLIGIGTYATDRLAGPPGAAAYAREAAKLLSERGAADIAADRVRLLTDAEATESAIRAAMKWLAGVAREVDVVHVYLAGRAVRSATGEAAGLVPYDTWATYGPGSVSWAELDSLFRSLPAEVVVLAELADGEARAVQPPLDGACGFWPLPAGGLAVLAASGAADGSFSRRALELLAGQDLPRGAPVTLADLVRTLDTGADTTPILRTRGPVFDPTLPLTTVPREN